MGMLSCVGEREVDMDVLCLSETLYALSSKDLPFGGILLMQFCNFGRWNTRLRFRSAVAHNE
jgi:hypothetical protein